MCIRDRHRRAVLHAAGGPGRTGRALLADLDDHADRPGPLHARGVTTVAVDSARPAPANPGTGAAALTVPLGLPGARTELELNLSLAYDSTAGNGPFGMGWQIAVP